MKNSVPLISIVSPVYRAESVVVRLVEEIEQNLKSFTTEFEIILVDDLSPDRSWEIIQEICIKNKYVKAIKLSRNFGQHYAITAGLQYAKGDWIVVMDCDLQDNPSEIINLYNKAQEGFDIVQAQRIIRLDGFWKKMSSKFFYFLFELLSGIEQDSSIANFGIYSRKVIKSFNEFSEPMRSFPSIINWLGFKKTTIDVKHGSNTDDRETAYTFRTLFVLGFSVILSFSNKPLRFTIFSGAIIAAIGFGIGSFYVFRYLYLGSSISGFTTIASSIWFLSGIIIISLGVVGLYIGSIFDTVKKRPLFIVDETIGINQ